MYSGAHAGAYEPSEEACAQAILGQADRRLDFRKVIEQAGKDMGSEIKMVAFERMQLGEGIEKKEEDFAAEVAAVAGN